MNSNSSERKTLKNSEKRRDSSSPSPKKSMKDIQNLSPIKQSPSAKIEKTTSNKTQTKSKSNSQEKDKRKDKETRNSLYADPNQKSEVNTQSNIDRSVFKKHLPKNVNQYRHIIDTMQSRDSDVEWVLELRAYEQKKHYESLKESQGDHPNIYKKSFDDYRDKVEKDIKDRKRNHLQLKGNAQYHEHLMKGRIGMAANPTQLGFDSTLRTFLPEKVTFMNAPWKSVNLSPKKNLFNTYLPPLRKLSKEILDSKGSLVLRPYEQIEDEAYVNGNPIRRRKYVPSSTLTLKFAGEHLASQPYTYKYADKNVNSIRHLLGQQINSLGAWESDLRGYKKMNDRYDDKITPEQVNKA